MVDQLEEESDVSFKSLLMSEFIQSEALLNLLEKKGIISKRELVEEIRRVRAYRRQW